MKVGRQWSAGAGWSAAYVTWAHWATRLYPRAWRERYGEEVRAVLQQHHVSLWTVFDIVLGALDAHLRRDLLPGRIHAMAHRIRTSEVAIFCAFVLFGVAWLIVQQVRDPLPDWERVTLIHPEIRVTFIAVQLAGLVALLAVLAGGAPLLVVTISRAVRARRWRVLALFLVPFLAFAGLIALVIVAAVASTQRQSPAPNAPFAPLAVALQLVLVLAFLLAVAGSTAAIAWAVALTEPSERVLRFALVPAAVATLGIVVGLTATVVLDALTLAEAPQLNPPFVMVLITGAMLGAAALAAAAFRRGLTALRAGS